MYSKKKRKQDANVCREITEIEMYMLVLHWFGLVLKDICLYREDDKKVNEPIKKYNNNYN